MSTIVESEMKEFFQRVIDSVAELSTQAAKVEGLTDQVRELTERVNQFELDNRTLMSQVNEANRKAEEFQAQLNGTQSSLDNERAVTAALRQTIVERDAGVQSLEQSFRNEQDAHKITTSERDDARQRVRELEQSLESSKQSYDDVFHDRDNWRQKFWEAEKEAANVKQQLDKIQSVLNPLRVVSQDVASA
jgi:chromosome segregation ATPase